MKRVRLIFELLIFSVILVALFAVFLFNRYEDGDSAVDDSSAIFGGKDEDGYPSAGYLVSYESANTVTTCGLTYVSQNIAVTAAHCVENSNTFFVGVDEFSYIESANFEVLEIFAHPQWDGEQRAYDLAVIRFENEATVSTSTIAPAEVGCGYEIVGYGSTELDATLDPGVRLRKSYQLCIDAFTDNNIYFSGETGGVCFGDSGSPIFKTGTNQVVGVLSAVFPLPGFTDRYCDIGNNALAVRLDTFESYVAQYSQSTFSTLALCGESCSNNSQCAEGLSCSSGACTTPSGSCQVASGNFCAIGSGISCSDGATCAFNSCVEQTNVSAEAINDQVLQLQSGGSSFIEENRNLLIAFISLVFLINFYIILNSKQKRQYY